MKRFDTIKSTQHTAQSTQVGDSSPIKEEILIANNHSSRSYRDIKKRGTIDLLGKITHFHTPFNFRRMLIRIIQEGGKKIHEWQQIHWITIVLICLIGYVLYGVGCMFRTNAHIQAFEENPSKIFSTEGITELRAMRRDYQILAPIFGNPIVPIEPFRTYGNVLSHGYRLVSSFHEIESLQQNALQLLQDKNASIFPILEKGLAWMRGNSNDFLSLLDIVEARIPTLDIAQIRSLWTNILSHEKILSTIFGKNKPTRILLLNQNSDELRAGGGFPGTAFIIEFDQGKITKFQFTDIYALDWHLTGYRPSPEGINKLHSLDFPGKPLEFEIRDANYYPQFSASASKLDELARTAGIGPLDLVIGINQKFLEDLVQLVEPLDIPGVPVKIDHRNVTLVLSMLVEGKKTLKGTPKSTVQILAKKLFAEIQTRGKTQEAMLIIAKNMYTGELIAGSPRVDIQAALDSLGIFDRWQWRTGDWLYPIFTSISRNKSDRFMERTFEIDQSNSCDRTLTLTQKHWFDLIEESRIENLAQKLGLADKIKMLTTVQGDGNNVQYLRFILPPGTTILPHSDARFRLAEANVRYAMIDGYETTRPGTTRSLTIRYRLPRGHCDDRSEFFKQPGLRNTRFVVLKNGIRVFQKYFE